MDIINDSDNQDGTSIHTIKKVLNDIGYVPQYNQNDQMNDNQQNEYNKQLYQQKLREEIYQQQLYEQMQKEKMAQYEEEMKKKMLIEQQIKNKNTGIDKQKKMKLKTMASCVNKNLDDYMPSKFMNKYLQDDQNEESNKSNHKYLTHVMDFIIIIVLYVLVTNNKTKKLLDRFINNDDGSMSFNKLLLQGFIFSMFYTIIKLVYN